MAATDQMPDPNKALAPREPSTHGPRTMASGICERFHKTLLDEFYRVDR